MTSFQPCYRLDRCSKMGAVADRELGHPLRRTQCRVQDNRSADQFAHQMRRCTPAASITANRSSVRRSMSRWWSDSCRPELPWPRMSKRSTTVPVDQRGQPFHPDALARAQAVMKHDRVDFRDPGRGKSSHRVVRHGAGSVHGLGILAPLVLLRSAFAGSAVRVPLKIRTCGRARTRRRQSVNP